MDKWFSEKTQCLQGLSMLENSKSVPCAIWERPGNKMCTLMVTFKDGVAYELEEEWGYSHFLEHLHFKRTKNLKSFYELVSFVEEVGGRVSAFTTRETISYIATVPIWEIKKGFYVLKEILTNTHFDENDVSREKPLIREEIVREKANPRVYNKVFLEETLLAPLAVSRLPLGSYDSISKGDGKNLLAYKQKGYGFKNMFVTLTGDFDRQVVQLELEDFLSHFSKGENRSAGREQALSLKSSLRVGTGLTYLLDYPGARQTNLSLGWKIPKLDERSRMIWQLFNSMMGVGFASRLFQRLREDCGLTYLVQSTLRPYHTCGTWRIDMDVFAENVLPATEALEKLFIDIRQVGIPKESLMQIKKACWGNILAELEDGQKGAKWVVQHLNLFGHVDYLQNYGQHIASVTEEELLDLMDSHLSWSQRNVCLAGEKAKVLTHYSDSTIIMPEGY